MSNTQIFDDESVNTVYAGDGRYEHIVQQEINGNWYLLHYGPPTDELQDREDHVFIHIWVQNTGERMEITDPLELPTSKYQRVVEKRELKIDFDLFGDSFQEFVQDALVDAVSQVENRMSAETSVKRDIKRAVEELNE